MVNQKLMKTDFLNSKTNETNNMNQKICFLFGTDCEEEQKPKKNLEPSTSKDLKENSRSFLFLTKSLCIK